MAGRGGGGGGMFGVGDVCVCVCFYFRGAGDQRPNFMGNRETKMLLGNRTHKKTSF